MAFRVSELEAFLQLFDMSHDRLGLLDKSTNVALFYSRRRFEYLWKSKEEFDRLVDKGFIEGEERRELEE